MFPSAPPISTFQRIFRNGSDRSSPRPRRSKVRKILRQRRRNRVAFRRVRPRLLLASNSPRRRELLLEARFEFEIFPTRFDERFHVQLTLRELTALNATRKALTTPRLRPKHRILTP